MEGATVRELTAEGVEHHTMPGLECRYPRVAHCRKSGSGVRNDAGGKRGGEGHSSTKIYGRYVVGSVICTRRWRSDAPYGRPIAPNFLSQFIRLLDCNVRISQDRLILTTYLETPKAFVESGRLGSHGQKRPQMQVLECRYLLSIALGNGWRSSERWWWQQKRRRVPQCEYSNVDTFEYRVGGRAVVAEGGGGGRKNVSAVALRLRAQHDHD